MKNMSMVRSHKVVSDHEAAVEPAKEVADERSVTERDAPKFLDKD